MAISKIQSDSITDSAITSNKISGGAIGVSDLGTQVQSALGTRNLIINGNMQIAQRATSVAGITSSGYYTVDRFSVPNINIGTWTQSQDTDVPSGQGFAKSLKMQCTSSASLSAGSILEIHQLFEGQNVQHLKKGTANAESLTLSFWVKTNKTGTYTTSLIDNDNLRHIGATYTVSSADTWEKKTITFSGDTSGALDNDNNVSLRVIFHLALGTDWTSGTAATVWEASIAANRAVGQTVNLADSTSNYINITGVQLEVGDTATPFENLPYDVQLARCQRYYYRLYDTAPNANGRMIGTAFMWSTTAIRTFVTFPVTMRDLPSVESSNFTDAFSAYIASVEKYLPSLGVAFSGAESTRGCLVSGTITVAGTSGDAGYIRFKSTFGASLAFSAEL